ncbi:MAG TPA: YdeI/OmpD-associated family protein [Candidatus Saccharimonadales bacterium]|nr:YdeI/OmpD-associated family protein [Candidatus Saccharimonadales bacterium]
MAKEAITGGTVHQLPADLRKALLSNTTALEKWEGLTPLARNEWICWAVTVKQPETRKNHITRTIKELLEGKRRPCCWLGCMHRTDKPLSPSVQWVLSKKSKSK